MQAFLKGNAWSDSCLTKGFAITLVHMGQPQGLSNRLLWQQSLLTSQNDKQKDTSLPASCHPEVLPKVLVAGSDLPKGLMLFVCKCYLQD